MRIEIVAATLAVMALGGVRCALDDAPPDVRSLVPVVYGGDFWDHWGDGRAELASYELTFPRYGEARNGRAVAIFVTETFSESARVKAGPGRDAADTFPVLKLNLVRDFQTGIYDYNLMTSSFVALEALHGRPAGSPTKVSFSSQEWCGNTYHQLIFSEQNVRQDRHSYFDGEGDATGTLPYPVDGISEDGLLMWARGLAAPALKRGESREVSMLTSTLSARLQHQPIRWSTTTLSREADLAPVTVPAGVFDADVYRAVAEGGRAWTIYVEDAFPHRVLRWETSEGESGRLIASERLEYWEQHRQGDERQLDRLGLEAHPLRSP